MIRLHKAQDNENRLSVIVPAYSCKVSHVMEGQNFQTHTTHKNNILIIEPKGPVIQVHNCQAFLEVITFACEALIACTKQLNIMDETLGDGNYGYTLAQCANAIKTEIKENKILALWPCVALKQISRIIERESACLEGKIYATFFDAAAKSFLKFQNDEQVTANMWLAALTSANMKISEFSGMSLGNRTMMDALIPAEYALKNALDSNVNPVYAFEKAVEAAETFAMKTANMVPSPINSKTSKYPDPGAHAVGIWMRAACEGVKLKFGYEYYV